MNTGLIQDQYRNRTGFTTDARRKCEGSTNEVPIYEIRAGNRNTFPQQIATKLLSDMDKQPLNLLVRRLKTGKKRFLLAFPN